MRTRGRLAGGILQVCNPEAKGSTDVLDNRGEDGSEIAESPVWSSKFGVELSLKRKPGSLRC